MTAIETLIQHGNPTRTAELLLDAAKAAGWTWEGGVLALAGVPREIVEQLEGQQ